MQKVYSHENLAMVNSAKNLLVLNGIACSIKNEYYAGGGHVGLSGIPVELWVEDSSQADNAIAILKQNLDPPGKGVDWKCPHCGETNSSSFEVCWQCQHAPSHQP